MPESTLKQGSMLLIQGLNSAVPAEYIDAQSASMVQNFSLDRAILSKRYGTSIRGGIIGAGTLTLTANAGNTETVIIGTKTYTFQTVLTNVDGNVFIGASASASIDNLIAAINLAAGAGSLYAAATTAQPQSVVASAGAGDTMTLTVSASDNSTIATTETLANGSFGASAMVFATDLELMGGREITIDSVKYNVRIGRDKVERYNSGTSKWIDITGTDLTGTSDNLIDTAIPLLSGSAILVISNGVDNLRKWTGTGNASSLGGTPPVAKFIQEYKTYLLCANIAGGVDIDQRVQWSDTANPEEWSTGNAGAQDLVEDGEAITGLNVFSDYVVVHKKTSIYLGYLVSTQSIFRFDRKSTQVGTVANGSIVNLPTGQQIFLGVDGLHLFNGVTTPVIESPVNDEIRDGINQSYAHKSWGLLVQDEDEVWIGVPIGDQTTGETVYKYNYKTGVCYKDIRLGVNTAWAASTSEGLTWDDFADSITWDDISNRWDDGQLGGLSADIHFGKTDGNTFIQSISVNGDGSDTIPCIWTSKQFENQEKGRMCRWSEVHVYAKGSGALTVEYSIDGGNTWIALSGSPITLDTYFPDDDDPQVVYLDVISSRLQLRFRNDTSTDVLEIKQFYVGYLDRELRR